MSLDLDKLRDTFFEEARELMSDMESGLLVLEAAPTDRDNIDRIFRAAHSIKGGSGTFGFTEITKTAHALESLLDKMRSGAIRAGRAHVDALLGAADTLGELLDARRRGEVSSLELTPVLSTLQSLLAAGATGGPPTYRLRVRPPYAAAVDPLTVLTRLLALGRVREAKVDHRDVPALGELDAEALHIGFDLLLETTSSAAELRGALAVLEGDVSVEPVGAAPVDAPAATAAGPGVPAAARAAAPAEVNSIRVAIEKLDGLMNLVGELVIAQSMVADVIAHFSPDKLPILQAAASELERHTRELQERVMAVRMVPVGTVFQRFPRLVRDTSAQCGKSVNLELRGAETELDKGLVERIADPLTHMVRNCIDHGIEPAAARVAAGKPAAGTVRLEAYHRGGSVFIEISDDGRGLDTARILAKAIERGLAPKDAVMTEEQIHALIFAPGFSTAETVSDLSGRGVGMDVVRRGVESMNGTLSIVSTPGKGTRFCIRLPMTLAILDGQYFALGDRTFVIPLLAIRESMRTTSCNLRRVLGRGELVMVRGEPIPLVRLRHLFGVGGEVPTDPVVVVVESDGVSLAIEVDALLGQSQVVIKNIETHYQKVEGIMGATIMGNGEVAMIIDVPGLSRGTGRAERGAWAHEGAAS